jgi:hypothetical protein
MQFHLAHRLRVLAVTPAGPRRKPMKARHYCLWQRGQSTVEFVVLALVMLPMLLIVPLLGKYMDIAQATTLASRYVAFEAVARHSSSAGNWKSDSELAQEVRRRFFSNSDAPVKTGDKVGDFNAHRNTLWFDYRGNPLIAKLDDNLSVRTGVETMLRPNVVSAIFAGKLGLSYDNVYSGEVGVALADVAGLQPFDAIGLSIVRKTALLADPWEARDPGAVSAAIRRDGSDLPGPFPYQPLSTIAAPLGVWIRLLEPTPDIGRVEPDRVPADRLGSAP